MFHPHVILHPTDYSDCARYAFAVAADLARCHGATLVVLHVADTLGPEEATVGEAATRLQPDVRRPTRLREELERFAPAQAGLSMRHLLAEGDPGKAIADAVRRERCDLVVMGTYGRSALSRLLTGSVTQKVAHLVPCAVLTVRMPQGAGVAG
jgi:nucleotide-binding universal stress UspA family protein